MQTALITGSTDGIGRETAKQLAKRGYRIIIHGRNQDKAERIKSELNEINPTLDHIIQLADLNSQEELLDLSFRLKQNEEKIDVLINNAGIYKNKLEYSREGIEKTAAVNYHSHFILTLLLLPLLNKTEEPRIINFSSMVHSHSLDPAEIWDPINFSGSQAYSDSKLAMILFTFKLARNLNKATVNCLHPGVINTKLLRRGWGAGGSSVEKGAKTPVYLADSEQVKNKSGYYFVNKNKKKAANAAYDHKLQDQLWQESIDKIKYSEILNKISEKFKSDLN